MKIGRTDLAKDIIHIKNVRDNIKINELNNKIHIFSVVRSRQSEVKSLSLAKDKLDKKIDKRETRLLKKGTFSEEISSQTTHRLARKILEQHPRFLERSWDEKKETQVEKTLYDLYANDKPIGHSPLKENDKKVFFYSLFEMSKKNKIIIQSQSGIPLSVLRSNKKAAFSEFAYFIIPNRSKQKSEGQHSRIALSFDSQYAKTVLPLLASIVSKEKSIDCAKIMGPDEQGVRTDSAIIYFEHTNADKIEKVVNNLREKLGGMLTPHTPIGMKSKYPGISYSEFSNIHPDGKKASTSHGMARAEILTSAIKTYVMQSERSATNLEQIIDNTFQKSGYAIRDTALLDSSSITEAQSEA
ncbi:hypothetical protein VSA01S_15630 [Vibrio sagamiensis NBRC 104589]|uniref:Uncharacterized protein n=1 Tax=Vibrio sagamiensis NBRC 104589 TaxID=1219064 RepID=A0A511QDR5_9VIBR|nr:hypothetical protein VSA01S_15630 [Vibrio sagamiensis NBRC 104589]